MIKNFLSSIVVSLFLILLVILCSENDKEESRHEPQNTWFYMPTQKEVEYEGYFYPYSYRDIWQDISLHIKELKSFQNGSLRSRMENLSMPLRVIQRSMMIY